jgi:hypothetical protein
MKSPFVPPVAAPMEAALITVAVVLAKRPWPAKPAPATDICKRSAPWGKSTIVSFPTDVELNAKLSLPPAPIKTSGGDVRNIEDEYPGVGLLQRFLVMNDQTVGLFVTRDRDARLSAAEADLVQQWIESGYPFH